MVISTQDSRGRGKVFEQITNFELQPGPQIPPDSARRNILVQRPSAVGTKVDKYLVIQRQIIRSGSGSISRQWHVRGEAIAESLSVIPRISMVILILPSLKALLYTQPVRESQTFNILAQ